MCIFRYIIICFSDKSVIVHCSKCIWCIPLINPHRVTSCYLIAIDKRLWQLFNLLTANTISSWIITCYISIYVCIIVIIIVCVTIIATVAVAFGRIWWIFSPRLRIWVLWASATSNNYCDNKISAITPPMPVSSVISTIYRTKSPFLSEKTQLSKVYLLQLRFWREKKGWGACPQPFKLLLKF